MTIQQIKYVLALDTYRHFVRAAASCFVTQSTLTIQVKKLEEEIGTELFDRSKHPLEPTAMGEIFIGKARQIAHEIQALKDSFNTEYKQTTGHFRIGIIPTLAPYLLPLFLSEFLEAHPETHLDIEELESETILDGIKSGRLDIGVLSTPTNESDIKELPLFYEPFLLFAHQNNTLLHAKGRVKIEDLDTKKLWLLAKGHCFRNQMINFCDLSTETCTIDNLSLEGGSIETLKRMIRKTSGFTLIPELSVDDSIDISNIKRFETPQPAREISLIVQKNFTKQLLLKELKACISTHIPKHLKNTSQFKAVAWR